MATTPRNKGISNNRKLNAFNLGNIVSDGQSIKGIDGLPNHKKDH